MAALEVMSTFPLVVRPREVWFRDRGPVGYSAVDSTVYIAKHNGEDVVWNTDSIGLTRKRWRRAAEIAANLPDIDYTVKCKLVADDVKGVLSGLYADASNTALTEISPRWLCMRAPSLHLRLNTTDYGGR